ncbi:MAG: hypothetical protein WAV72_14110 [Bradyrhizobium sp.]
MNCQDIDRPHVVPLYRSIVLEIERRRLHLGVSMDELSDRAGVADRFYSKMLYPDTPSGRQARWSTLQEICDAIFPEGFDVEIRPKAGRRLDAEDLRCKIKFAAAPKDGRSQRELMRELGRRGGIARREKYKTMPRKQRLALAKKARKTRRKNRALRSQLQRLAASAEARL